MEVTCTPPPSLTTIPPELLLRVISFLPGSSALLALSQSSSGLRQFVSLHASSICNESILSRFTIPSIILHSQFQDGWLVPTNPIVGQAEDTMLGQKRKLCAAHRGPGQSTPSELSSLITDLESDTLSRCKPRDNEDLRCPLSSPGPLYLAFLEQYGWEVELEVFVERFRHWDEDAAFHVAFNEEMGRNPSFLWDMSTYTIRPFLHKLDSLISPGDCGCGAGCDIRLVSPRTAPMAESGLGHRLLSKAGLGKMFASIAKKEKGTQMLFGELPWDLEELELRIGNICGLNKECISAVLLWAVVTGNVEGLVPSSPVYNTMEAPPMGDRKKQSTMNLMRDIKDRAKIVGRSVRLGLVASKRMVSSIHQACSGKKRGFVLLK